MTLEEVILQHKAARGADDKQGLHAVKSTQHKCLSAHNQK